MTTPYDHARAGKQDEGDMIDIEPVAEGIEWNPEVGPGGQVSFADGGAGWTESALDSAALADMQAFRDLKTKRKKQRKKRIIAAVCSVLALAVLAAGGVAWYMADQASRAVDDFALQTAFVERGTFTDTVSASGSLKPVASVSATPEIDGNIGEVYVSEGDTVSEGDALYTIVNDDLDKAVAQAQQGIDEAYNGIAQAQNAVNDAYRAKSSGEQQAASQAKALADAKAAGVEGAADMGEPVFDAASADAAIRQAELALNSANLALQSAQTTYDEAVARAAKRTVTASISGSIIAVNIEPGEALGAAAGSSTTPVQIADLSQMTVSIAVSEVDILKVSTDQPATATFTAAPDLELPAQVMRIATAAIGSGNSQDMYGSYGGAVTYGVDLLIDEPDPRLKPGMTAKATIVTTTIENTLLVPISALQSGGTGPNAVLVVTDSETMDTKLVEVEVLASDGMMAAVKASALSEGDMIVAGGSMGGSMDGGMNGGMSGGVVAEPAGVEVMVG
ncbi:efflux RND transporter periplasmic adaptor subunit [Raoultibacter phocaeensis]|uniref:efflux RND transporter periplasmic adaptor subunit n=1 Tax=Raoultibacter phocaeensis TaxID=2479841 RepID=UPI002103D876|nr:efflux RND transporter periplasmic adaptor subunit [Raoultibacter phocaeensis]